jgi:hypothetical protein
MSDEIARPAGGLSTALTVLIGLSVAAAVADLVLWWVIAVETGEYVAGPMGPFSLAGMLIGFAVSLTYLAAGITFVVWTFLARRVADTITPTHQHRWSTPWTIAGWIVPFVNVWIPGAVVQDIWRASDRSQPLVALRDRPRSGLIRAWWACFVVSFLVEVLTDVLTGQQPIVTPYIAAALYTVSVLALVPAAWLGGRVIRQIDDRQVSEPSAVSAPAA